MLITCTKCNGTGHRYNDEGQVTDWYDCKECDGLGAIEQEDEEDDSNPAPLRSRNKI